MTNLRFLGIAIALLLCGYVANAQIYSQGRNINSQNTFYLNVELVEKPQGPTGYIAKVDFYGRRKDITWYIKEGVEHKFFNDKDEMIHYLEENGWYYLKSGLIRASSSNEVRVQYYFRKSMAQLSKEYETEANIKAIYISEY